MCGYCVEKAALNLIEEEVLYSRPLEEEELDGIFVGIMAQESRYPLHVAQIAEARELLSEVLYVLHCQGIGELPSQATPKHRNTLTGAALVKYYHDYRRMLAKKFPEPERLVEILPHPDWAVLYGPDLLFSESDSRAFCDGPDLGGQCVGLLEEYRDWWLQGKGLEENGPDQRWAETRVLDPLEDVAVSEINRFALLFPALFFALHHLAYRGTRMDLLAEVALTVSPRTPGFLGLDLWLQRRALSMMIRREGPDFLMRNLNRDLRDALVRHAFLRHEAVRANRDTIIRRLQELLALEEGLTEFRDDAQATIVWMATWPGGVYQQ
ncbi:hypothetical protein SAMN05660653_02092 [Desulfonatronum thiosulfatophilum]|uniref:Uncharacterized protein n=1 Tax=Desulfonatronum thiosulfatophilum TaxID=617002 RepID=A0A1G6DDY2_9BACT|nr:hypothetical protein [Desulfonatronum thiosulfatophilum]SDB43330.1 hypothetical protein SAMN05660653_02092 [Desulfonatronum thiosulfatophilum]